MERWRRAAGIALVRLRFVVLLAAVAVLAVSRTAISTVLRQLTRQDASPQAAPTREGAWICPMHPGVRHGGPGKCATCGMPFVQKEQEPEPAAGAPVIELSPLRAQQGGIALATAQRLALQRELRTLAVIEADERRTARIASRVKGLVEAVHVAGIGALVKSGSPLVRLQVPDLLTLSAELFKEASASPRYPISLLRLRRQLITLGLTEKQLRHIEKTGDGLHLDLAAPLSGTVLEKSVLPGDAIAEGAQLLIVADLSRVLLAARLYEDDAAAIAPGAEVTLELPALPGRSFRARVSRIDPAVDRETRTLAVRAELANPDGALRPGMSGSATFLLPLGDETHLPLAVPEGAVLDTGLHRVVWREIAPERFAPVEVTVAARAGGFCAIASGLAEGDRVVASGAFLLAAEARLKIVRAPAPAHTAGGAP